MDRDAARRLLGVGEEASEAEVHAAYWALRAHVEERAHGSESAAFRAERARELRALDDALRLLAPRPPRGPASRTAAWLAAVTAVALCGVWVLVLARSDAREAPPLPPAPGPEAAAGPADAPEPPPAPAAAPSPPAEPARLVLRANLDDARARLRDPETDEVLAEGPVTGRETPLPPGAYELEVAHPDCPDVWSEGLDLAAGERREVDAQVCADTGFLVVRSDVVGDRLSVDDTSLGPTGPTRHALPAGEHRVRVEKPGYAPWTDTVRVAAAEQVTLHADLRPLQARASEPAPPPAEEPGFPQRIEDLREGYTGWHAAVKQRMLARWDADGSGRIDTDAEVRAIPCTEWRELERAYDQGGLAVPMSRLYGFDGSAWVEGALGFTFSVRELAYERMQECGLR